MYSNNRDKFKHMFIPSAKEFWKKIIPPGLQCWALAGYPTKCHVEITTHFEEYGQIWSNYHYITWIVSPNFRGTIW